MRKLHSSAIAVMAIALVACDSGDEGAAGEVRLTYVAVSESTVLFTLDNRSLATLKINGSRTLFSGIDLYRGDYSMRCARGEESDEYRDGFRDPPEFAEIRSGERVRLKVHGDLTQRFKGGRCQLKLMPMIGATVTSDEFVP